MPPGFHPTSVAMKGDISDQGWRLRWALPASFALHLLVAALLIFELPISLPQPQEEQAIAVDLVPPPEPPQKAQTELPPPAEQPKPPGPEQQAVEPAPPSGSDVSRPQTPPALRPVFQFGERDGGPRQSLDGNSAEDGSASPTPSPDPAEQTPAEPPTQTPAEAENETPPSETSETADATETPRPEASETPDTKPDDADGDRAEDASALAALSSPGNPDALEQPAETATEPENEVQLPETSETPSPRPAPAAPSRSGTRLQPAERLYSQSATGDRVATTAMGNVPRDVRGGRLCVTELREQLLRGSPPYFPDLLPSYPLTDGTVIDVSKAAFRVRGQWFDLHFRCEVDAGATKVVSFALRVGTPLPRSEWVRRGLPSQ
jgi:hypothetical protein